VDGGGYHSYWAGGNEETKGDLILSIKLGLVCTGKSSKLDKDNRLEYKLTFERREDASVDDANGTHFRAVKLEMTTSARGQAEAIRELDHFVLDLNADQELGGVFRDKSAPPPQGELPLEEIPMEWDELREEGFSCVMTEDGIAVQYGDNILTGEGVLVPHVDMAGRCTVIGLDAEADRQARLLATRAVRAMREQVEYADEPGQREETFEEKVARLTREAIEDTPEGATYTIEEIAFDVALALENEDGKERDQEEFDASVKEITPRVQAAMVAYQDEQRRVQIRELTRALLEEHEVTPDLEPVSLMVRSQFYGAETPTEEQMEEIRREVELLLAAKAAREAAAAGETDGEEEQVPEDLAV
jgi:hypothetical protein